MITGTKFWISVFAPIVERSPIVRFHGTQILTPEPIRHAGPISAPNSFSSAIRSGLSACGICGQKGIWNSPHNARSSFTFKGVSLGTL